MNWLKRLFGFGGNQEEIVELKSAKEPKFDGLYQYSAEWDDILNRLMMEHKFTKVGQHTAVLGSIEIWIANHPYASMRPYGFDVQPKRSTAIRAYEKCMKDHIEETMRKESGK